MSEKHWPTDRRPAITEACALEIEIKGMAWRLVEHIISKKSYDPEIVVTLRGSTERLIELAEETCKDN